MNDVGTHMAEDTAQGHARACSSVAEYLSRLHCPHSSPNITKTKQHESPLRVLFCLMWRHTILTPASERQRRVVLCGSTCLHNEFQTTQGWYIVRPSPKKKKMPFTIAKKWDQPRCLLTNERIRKCGLCTQNDFI